MVELAASAPLGGTQSQSFGQNKVSVVPIDRMVSLSPFLDCEAASSAALTSSLGLALPPVGATSVFENRACIWAGHRQWFVHMTQDDMPGVISSLSGVAAVTDQSSGWCVLALRGPQSRGIMARLCPLDLRSTVFPTGQCARTEFAHMASLIVRQRTGYDIYLMRSFARTGWDRLTEAARSVMAQKRI